MRINNLTLLISFALISCLFAPSLHAQDTTKTKKYNPFDAHLTLASSHLWRGYIVTNDPVLKGTLTYTTRDQNLQIGLYDGVGFNGQYTEFCYFLAYHIKGFEIDVLDSHNNSGFPKADIFNYNPASTRHYIDVNLIYHFGNNFPLTASVATVVQGRDTYTDSEGNLKNLYSNYAELDYRVYQAGDANVHLYVGGAWSFVARPTFYSSSPGIVNTGIVFNKNVYLGKYKLPVYAQAMWNPDQKIGTVGLGVQIF